jgi:hypothetical protein
VVNSDPAEMASAVGLRQPCLGARRRRLAVEAALEPVWLMRRVDVRKT